MPPRGKRRAVRPRAPAVVPRWYAVTGLVAIASAGFAVVHGRDVSEAQPSALVVHHVRAPLTINGSAALSPDPAEEQPQLTAEEAWARSQQGADSQEPMPGGTTIYLGLFTEATIVDRLSYVFRLPTSAGCDAIRATPSPTAAATTAPEATCRAWVVVDANTGDQLADEQEIQVPTG